MAAPPIPHWRRQILKGIGAPVTPQNLLFLADWAKAEGGNAANNPFNTTQHAAGASAYNSVGVRNYTSPLQGLQATVQTLKNGRYGNILDALRQGTSARSSAQALASSPWGTGSLVLKMLGGGAGGAQPAGPPVSPLATLASKAGGGGGAGGLTPGQEAALLGANQAVGLTTSPQLLELLSASQPHAGAPAPRATGGGAMRALQTAKSFLGTPYQYGGNTKQGIDCSALLQQAWGAAGIKIPRTTHDQYKTGTPIGKNELEPGDAVFFTGSDPKNGLPGHVGIYVGDGKFIESPHTGSSVHVSTLAGRTDYVGARRYGQR